MTRQLGLVIDQERCIGCDTCTVACTMENKPATGHWIHVETMGSGKKDIPSGVYPDLRMEFLPKLCMHCENPKCILVCQTDALCKRDDGLVLLNQSKCNGCGDCVKACPYEAMNFDAERCLVEKCTMCSHRIDQGLEPFCVVCCEGQAMHFGDINNPSIEVVKLLASRDVFVLLPEAGTGPSIHYCRPKHRRKL